MNEVTRILSAIEQGDSHAAEQLLPLVYDELRRLAAQRLAQEKPGQTLQATALVHEAYLRLVAGGDGSAPRERRFADSRHFFAVAAEAMRRILVESARRKGLEKLGGGQRREHADLEALNAGVPAEELLTLAHAAGCLNVSLSTTDCASRYARDRRYNAMSADNPQQC